MEGAGLRLLFIAILTPIVLISVVIGALKRRVRPERSLILFRRSLTTISFMSFRVAVQSVEPLAIVTDSALGTYTARVGGMMMQIKSNLEPLAGIGSYRVSGDDARKLLRDHLSWSSLIVSAQPAELANAERLAARVAAELIDDHTTAIWSSSDPIVRPVDANVISHLKDSPLPSASLADKVSGH